jgi:hypothetical protein
MKWQFTFLRDDPFVVTVECDDPLEFYAHLREMPVGDIDIGLQADSCGVTLILDSDTQVRHETYLNALKPPVLETDSGMQFTWKDPVPAFSMDTDSGMHIDVFARGLFGIRIDPIIREGDSTYDDWTLDTECGQRCRDVLLAAYTLYGLTRDADERNAAIRIAHDQCQVICYS